MVSARTTPTPRVPLRIWRGWMRIARVIGNFNARVLFSIFYFVLGGPIALVVQRTSDPLDVRTRRSSYWHQVEEEATLQGARKQH